MKVVELSDIVVTNWPRGKGQGHLPEKSGDCLGNSASNKLEKGWREGPRLWMAVRDLRKEWKSTPRNKKGASDYSSIRSRDPVAPFNGVMWVSHRESTLSTPVHWKESNLTLMGGTYGEKLMGGEGVLSIFSSLIGWADAGSHELLGAPKHNV